jgi:hypothetical protein
VMIIKWRKKQMKQGRKEERWKSDYE